MWEYRDTLSVSQEYTLGAVTTIKDEIIALGRIDRERMLGSDLIIDYAVMTEEGADNLWDLAMRVRDVHDALECHGLTMEEKRDCIVDVLKDGTTVKPNFSTPESKAVA